LELVEQLVIMKAVLVLEVEELTARLLVQQFLLRQMEVVAVVHMTETQLAHLDQVVEAAATDLVV
jgi:hypothetical protein